MNPLQLPLHKVLGPCPTGPIIRAATLAPRITGAEILSAAHTKAERLQHAAEAVLAQAQAEAARIRENAYSLAAEEGAVLAQQACDKAVADTVQWLCDEQALEQVIARQLVARWRPLMATVLGEMLDKVDQTELLLRRIERKVQELLPHGAVSLYVAPLAVASTRTTFMDTPTITVLPDETLAAGQARLDNGLVRIHLDLPAQQQFLLAQLRDNAKQVAHA
ncbi:hypothetical protein [Chitinimonas sp. BJB300]|uniref:hypothetical protein n=1 Tax=Chitinimonas sp. BJB300 TaxID=1559339 RepID=UPI000C0CB3DF|nr:hypothetical protein [Chitinimonas sp. BJB300]PHV11500.1 hypothetical protein CSQ89_10740 [Chitinimonas sp. BJB300]TSJ88505.1 hypothetical protein FG002_010045 [Chitinimonas sp. BJB300]